MKILKIEDIYNQNIAVYIRGNKKETFERREQDVLEFLRFEGETNISSIRFFIDTNNIRDNFNKMLEAINSGMINRIIVERISDIGDTNEEIAKFIEEIVINNNIRFLSFNEDIDTSKLEDYEQLKSDISSEDFLKSIAEQDENDYDDEIPVMIHHIGDRKIDLFEWKNKELENECKDKTNYD